MITIIGSKADAVEIKARCAEFLKDLKLTLNEDKTLITNPNQDSIQFLGYLIQKAAPKVNVYQRKYGKRLKKVRILTSGGIYLKVDSERTKRNLAMKGFCQGNGNPIPNFRYLSNTQHGTIIQAGYILRGMASYYKLAENSRQMICR